MGGFADHSKDGESGLPGEAGWDIWEGLTHHRWTEEEWCLLRVEVESELTLTPRA